MQNKVHSSGPTVHGREYYCDEHVKNDDGHAAASPERNPGRSVSGFDSLLGCNSTDSDSETNIRMCRIYFFFFHLKICSYF